VEYINCKFCGEKSLVIFQHGKEVFSVCTVCGKSTVLIGEK
jgi:transcription elongation factor Elf1